MVVDDDPESLGVLDGTVRRRYGQDYLIIGNRRSGRAGGWLDRGGEGPGLVGLGWVGERG